MAFDFSIGNLVRWMGVLDGLGGDVSELPPQPRLIRSPWDAEQAVAEWLRYWGVADAHVCGGGGPDQGKDVDSSEIVAQVKAQVGATGRPVVQQAHGVAAAEDKRAAVFSIGGFTREAREWADMHSILLFRFDLSGEPQPDNVASMQFVKDRLGRSDALGALGRPGWVSTRARAGELAPVFWDGSTAIASRKIEEWRGLGVKPFISAQREEAGPTFAFTDLLFLGTAAQARPLAVELQRWYAEAVRGLPPDRQMLPSIVDVHGADLVSVRALEDALAGHVDRYVIVVLDEASEVPADMAAKVTDVFSDAVSWSPTEEGSGSGDPFGSWLWPFCTVVATTVYPDLVPYPFRDLLSGVVLVSTD